MKGNVLAMTNLPEETAVSLLAAAETQCLSRVVPVQRRVQVSNAEGSFPAVAQAAAQIGRLGEGDRFLVRCTRRGEHDWRSRQLERAVAAQLERTTGAIGECEAEVGWLVSIEVYQNLAFIGVNRPSQVLRKTLRRQRKYRPGERPLNRAEWKIKEALQEFGVSLRPEARVLDLGAAPGGWTRVLAAIVSEVVAVDPADLDPRVAALPNVRHIRARAEALEAIAATLCGRPFDLLTCDMNLDPSESAEIMCSLASLLKPGAPAIMTVKYMTRHRRRHEADARRRLAEEYCDINMKRLPHNAYETTAAMRRPPAGGSAAPSVEVSRPYRPGNLAAGGQACAGTHGGFLHEEDGSPADHQGRGDRRLPAHRPPGGCSNDLRRGRI
jgi:23S rRNA U2552 (ribose-2'-O)-methylase RlmE/FtsJ